MVIGKMFAKCQQNFQLLDQNYLFTLLYINFHLGTGMILATCSVLVAAFVEIERKRIMSDGGNFTQTLASENFTAANLSVFVQIPQFALIGASEVFTSVTGISLLHTSVYHNCYMLRFFNVVTGEIFVVHLFIILSFCR